MVSILNKTQTRRAVGYFRVSSVRQAGERHVSLETQKERFATYCQSTRSLAIRTFTDVDTGRKDNRKEYQGMLEFLRGGGADVVVVQYLDRFGRNPREILQRIWALQAIGVEVEASDEDIKEELMLLIRAGIAGAESRKTAARVKANMARAVSKGVHAARAPFGFEGIRHIDADGRARVAEFVHKPVEVSAIMEMYRLAVEENLGMKSIADRLNGLGYRTGNAKMFDPTTVRRILANEALRGALVYGKRPRKGNERQELIRIERVFPAVLTEEAWKELQERLNLRSSIHPHGRIFVSSYLLSGVARCGHCGGPMVGKTIHTGHYQYRRYYCSRAQKARALCGYYNGHNAERIDRIVLETLSGYADRDRALEMVAQMAEKQAHRIVDELREVEASIRTCEKDFETHLNLLKCGHISEAQFGIANDPVRLSYDSLLPRRKELQKLALEETRRKAWHEDLAGMLTNFAEDFKNLPVSQQKAKLMEVLEEIKVYRDKTMEIRFRENPVGS